MKHLKIALLSCVLLATTLCTVTAKAQEKSDTAFNTNPSVYSGTEQTALDTLKAVGETLTDTLLQKQVLAAVKTIEETPKENTVGNWVGYGFAVFGAAYGAYQYFQAQKCRRLVTGQDLAIMNEAQFKSKCEAEEKFKNGTLEGMQKRTPDKKV